MKFLQVFLALLMLTLGVSPEGSCSACPVCQQTASEEKLASPTEESAAANSTVVKSTEQRRLPVCCHTPAPAEDRETLKPGCCMAGMHWDSDLHQVSDLHGSHDCRCSIQVSSEEVPYFVSVPQIAGMDWLPLCFVETSWLKQATQNEFTALVPPDDKTRPHRIARCHLLDCVWLI